MFKEPKTGRQGSLSQQTGLRATTASSAVAVSRSRLTSCGGLSVEELHHMAAFGEDVSMGDFRPPQAENVDSSSNPEAKDGAGHTSDGSVLNVQIPTPRNDTAGTGISGGGVASAGAFGAAATPPRGAKVRACLAGLACGGGAGLCPTWCVYSLWAAVRTYEQARQAVEEVKPNLKQL